MPANPTATPGCVRAFMIVWLLGWTAGVAVFDSVAFGTLSRQLLTLTYARTDGFVTKSFVRSEGDSFALVIAYEYEVGGQKRTGDQYCHAPMKTNMKSWHKVAAEFPVGAVVPVYYDPAQPGEAVLHRGPTGFDLALLWFLTPFNIIAVGGWLVWLRGGGGGFDPADRRHVEPTDTGFRVHLPTVPRLAAFGGVLLGVTFVGVFVWGFGFGFNPPVLVIGAASAAAVAFAYGCANWYTHPVLEVDDIGRMFRLVNGSGAVEVPFNDVSDVSVTCEEKTDSEGDVSREYHCDTVRAAADPVRVASYPNADSAEALAAWLRGRLAPGA